MSWYSTPRASLGRLLVTRLSLSSSLKTIPSLSQLSVPRAPDKALRRSILVSCLQMQVHSRPSRLLWTSRPPLFLFGSTASKRIQSATATREWFLLSTQLRPRHLLNSRKMLSINLQTLPVAPLAQRAPPVQLVALARADRVDQLDQLAQLTQLARFTRFWWAKTIL